MDVAGGAGAVLDAAAGAEASAIIQNKAMISPAMLLFSSLYYYRSMRLLSNLCLVFTAFASGGALAAERAESGSAELILFGANWCAPCRAELADLPALAQAVWPQPLVVAWIDGTPALGKAGAPANVRVLDRRVAQALFDSFGSINAGVPLAIMRDRQGRICAVFKERVHVAALIAARQNCGI